jgi:glycolate oxidase FAD binding subunit
VDLALFADAVGADGPVTISGLGTRGGPVPGVRCVAAPAGIDSIQADEMIVCCGAGTAVDSLDAALASVGQRVALPPGGTVGGALALGRSGIRRLGDGPVRNTLLQARYVSAAGEVVKGGGPTVKNVSGFDICRLLVGSQGTLGFLGEVILRTRPRPATSQWFSAPAVDPWPLFGALHRPTAVLWDGSTVWVLLEGHPDDVAEQAAGLTAVDGPPPLPPGRTSVAPSALGALTGTFVAELGVGIVHGDAPARPAPDPVVVALNARVKHEFDPSGRLNPGRLA